MSGHGTLLPLPDDPRLTELLDAWPEPFQTEAIVTGHYYPRSFWLRLFEDVLRVYYPGNSSRDLSLTARHYAPFPLAAGHDVP